MSVPTIEFCYRGKEKYTLAVPSLEDHIGRMIVRRQTFYEQDLLERIAQMELCGMYVDIGAHIGNHSVYFARHTRCSHVVAVEVDPKLAEICETNLSRYAKSYEVHARACYDGSPVQVERMADDNSGMQRVVADPDGERSTTLREIVGDRSVALIKIDVEGGERVVLGSSITLLMEQHPVLVVESQTGGELEEMRKLLGSLGYTYTGPFAVTPTFVWRWTVRNQKG